MDMVITAAAIMKIMNTAAAVTTSRLPAANIIEHDHSAVACDDAAVSREKGNDLFAKSL